MGHGGKRPGAGAPKGNLNALKHGRRSKQYQRLVEIIAEDPEARQLAVDLANRKQRRQKRDIEVAKKFLEDLKRLAMAVALKQRAEAATNNSGTGPASDTQN